MNSSIIASAVVATGAIVAGILKLLKPKAKEGVTSKAGDVSDSMVAMGTNINQSYSPTVHNHYAEPPQNADPFFGKVESTPTIADIMNDLDQKRKPFEANQRYKHYVGLQVCWPVSVYGVWESRPPGRWTLRLESIESHNHSVIVEINIEEYPKLKVIDRGHPAWVEGKIRSVGIGDVYLELGAKLILK